MPTQKHFPNTGPDFDFTGIRACFAWLTEHGFSHGSMQREDPIGVAHGDADIAKWRNIDHRARLLLDGVIEPFDFGWRGEHGGAVLTLRDAVVPKDDARAAVPSDVPLQ